MLSEVTAAAHWRMVDFISDLHLHASEPATARAWKDYLARTRADAVFLLGDLFEIWVGDDALDDADTEETRDFDRDCIEALQAASRRRALYFLHGNRDFLFGLGAAPGQTTAAERAGLTLLADPATLVFGRDKNGQPARWLLSHGDALCLDDREYQAFRAQVRAPEWQQRFLSQPLAQRRAFARSLRAQSEARKKESSAEGKNYAESYADADPSLTRAWLQTAQAPALIHGHTHRPADHDLASGLTRHVLSDWHLDGNAPRADVLRLRLDEDGSVTLQRLAPAEA